MNTKTAKDISRPFLWLTVEKIGRETRNHQKSLVVVPWLVVRRKCIWCTSQAISRPQVKRSCLLVSLTFHQLSLEGKNQKIRSYWKSNIYYIYFISYILLIIYLIYFPSFLWDSSSEILSSFSWVVIYFIYYLVSLFIYFLFLLLKDCPKECRRPKTCPGSSVVICFYFYLHDDRRYILWLCSYLNVSWKSTSHR